jgi:hypothetical protein
MPSKASMQAARIRCRLQHQRRNRADQHRLRDALRAVAPDVPRHFTAAGRVPDVDRVLEIERGDERRQIVGVGIHLIAAPRLTRASVAAAVMSDAAVATRREKDHLVFPGIGRQRPAVTEDDRLSRPPVLVINLGAIAGLDRGH